MADGVAVFGSFSTEEAAESARRGVEESLRVATSITLANVNGRRYYRIVSGSYPEPEARALVQRANKAGSSAWYLSERHAARTSPAGPIRRSLGSLSQRGETNVSPSEAAVVPKSPSAWPPKLDSDSGSRRSKRATKIPAASVVRPPELPSGTSSEAPTKVANTRSSVEDIAVHNFKQLTLATSENPDVNRITLRRFDEVDIRIDGRVEENEWRQVQAYDQMLVIEPDTLEEPGFSTVTRMLFTSDGLYVSAVMEQPKETLVARLSGRDEFVNRDMYGITLDTSGNGLYGYWFAVNLGGSVMDGKVAPERNFSSQWDGPWESSTAETETGWSMEMFLPWSMMTMPKEAENREMGFWVNRQVAHINERYSWPALPFGSARFMSALNKLELPNVRPKDQWAVFPYVSSTYDNIAEQQQHSSGIDIFWRPASDIQLTATLSPDFGAVESDDVVVNLSAFETYFPEKRLFFLEGNEVFVTSPRGNPKTPGGARGSGGRQPPSLFTMEPTTLMNTRRIGGSARHVTIPDGITVAGIEQSKPTELIGAAKLVGQSGGLRYGILGAFEDDARLLGTEDATGARVSVEAPGRDFSVARVLYENIDTGRRAIGWMGTMVRNPLDNAITQGIDGHYLSANGKWSVDTQYMYSDVAGIQGHGAFSDFRYTPASGVSHRISLDYLDDSLDISDFGFVRQNDLVGGRYSYFKSTSRGLPSWLKSSSRGIWTVARANTEGRLTTGVISFFGTLLFNNDSELNGGFDWFSPSWDDRNSRGNGIFKLNERWFGALSYGTSSAKPFAVSLQGGFWDEDGEGTTYFADVGFTWQPMSSLSFDFDYRYRKRKGWLVHQGDRAFTNFSAVDLEPRFAVDYFLTARQHIRLTLQWAGIEATEQNFWQVPLRPGELERRVKDSAEGVDDFTISRLTAQLRYRWEIGPLSDLFLVYTRGSNLENHVTSDFDDLFSDALTDPIVNVFIVKLRYRFGS